MTGLSSEAGTAGGGGLDKDLATLLDVADEMNSPRMRAVVKRVEAELSRLREERKVLVGRSMEGWERAEAAETELRECRDSFTEVERVAMRVVAAETEASRLREQLDALLVPSDGERIPAIVRTWERANAVMPPSVPTDPADPSTNLATLAAIAHAKWRSAEAAETRCARLQQALIDYDGVLATAVSELHAQARQQYADTAPGELVDRVSDLVEAAKATRAKHRALRASLPAREALAGPGSEQSSLTESGSAGLPDTPADSQEPRDESGYPGLQGLEALADSQPETSGEAGTVTRSAGSEEPTT